MRAMICAFGFYRKSTSLIAVADEYIYDIACVTLSIRVCPCLTRCTAYGPVERIAVFGYNLKYTTWSLFPKGAVMQCQCPVAFRTTYVFDLLRVTCQRQSKNQSNESIRKSMCIFQQCYDIVLSSCEAPRTMRCAEAHGPVPKPVARNSENW